MQQQPPTTHHDEQRSSASPSNWNQIRSPNNIASIFQYKRWKNSSKVRLQESAPLSLFWHADEHLTTAIKSLHRVRDPTSLKFRHKCDVVHRAQRMILEAIYLTYSECSPTIRADKSYRTRLPPEDQRELEGGFSENILFAAQALARGFRIRGIESFTHELGEPARNLFAAMEALRFVFRMRTIKQDARLPYTDLEPVLKDFDQAWATFEQHICFCYFTVTYSGRPGRTDETAMFQVLMSETIMRAIRENLIQPSQIAELDPSIIFAVPRLTIIAGLIHMPDCITMTDAETGFRWFRTKAATLKHIQRELNRMGPNGIKQLEKMLVTGCDQIDDLDELDFCRNSSDSLASPVSPVSSISTGPALISAHVTGIGENNDKSNDYNNITLVPDAAGIPPPQRPHEEPRAPIKRPDHLRVFTRRDKVSDGNIHLPTAAEPIATPSTPSCQATPHEAEAIINGLPSSIKECNYLVKDTPIGMTSHCPSPIRNSSQTTLVDTRRSTKESLQKLFRSVCSIADELQSGSKAKEFVELLQRVFVMHGEEVEPIGVGIE